MSGTVSVYSTRPGSIGYCWHDSDGRQQSFRLRKGLNTVDAARFAEFAESDYGQPYVTRGEHGAPAIVSVVEDAPEPEPAPEPKRAEGSANEGGAPAGDPSETTSGGDSPGPLDGLNAAKTIAFLKETEDKELLKRVYETDERSTVRDAAAKRAAKLAE